jgi:hypothetical protein
VVFQQWEKMAKSLLDSGVSVMGKWQKVADNGVSAMGKMVKGC